MTCHNGTLHNDYKGPGIENPHPFPGADSLKCTVCHGGDGNGDGKNDSHVPPPPEIGVPADWIQNRTAYFNRLTLTGIDKFPDYTVGNTTYTALDYLQFIAPGDLRVVNTGRSCGQCHANHVDVVSGSVLATETGVFSGALFSAGVENSNLADVGLYEDTASDLGFRAVTDPNFPAVPEFGQVATLSEYPVYSVRNDTGPMAIHNNQAYNAFDLVNDLNADGTVVTGSHLAALYHEQVAFTCGDCHLGSAGANNRYGDFRSSGCTACHMAYALDGRSASGDPNVNKLEPLDPDDVDPPELPHLARHRIQSVKKTLPNGVEIDGISDYACAGCHQGSNRTVMQYWGIRLDQNADLVRGVQYPAQPISFQRTNNDTRLFDPVVNNNTFNGRNANQYILEEDYDGDGRDDTPPDVHYDAGMGCIDCHGSFDLHGGDVTTGEMAIMSRMEQTVAVSCESCHGTIDAYAQDQSGVAYDDTTQDLAVDRKGNVLPHVVLEGDGNFYLYSRVTGNRHFVPQTMDTVVDNGQLHPFTSQPLYSKHASYAMGRADGLASTGIGPQQTGGVTPGFAHTDSMDCVSCHASWTNSCIGCHLKGEYDTGNNFSNITGDRIVFEEDEAEFVYQTPLPFQLGVGEDNKITQIVPNTDMFFMYEDLNNNESQIFTFSDRTGRGSNTAIAPYPALSHNMMMAHSIRGRVSSTKEGPRSCTACHLTDDGMAAFGTEYNTFRTAMAADDFPSLDFNLLQQHIGRNTGNTLDSPMWVHMVAGLGSGLFLFDDRGCPVNPLDFDDERWRCDGVAPANNFDLNRVTYNLDRIVDENGVSFGSNSHPMTVPIVGPNRRDGSTDPNMAGPLGATLIQRLTDPATGIVLDSWVDADRQSQGDASQYVD